MALFSKCVLTGIFVALMISIAPILAANYNVGVKTGDWIKYEVSASWSGTGTEPLPLLRSDWVKIEVQRVIGTDVTVLVIYHYKDGTEETSTYGWDIETCREMWIIPAGLKKGDVLAVPSGDNMIINDTITRICAGASRSVNLLDVSYSFGSLTQMTTAYWDQTTGVLVEVSANMSSPAENWTLRCEAIETNMWSPTPLQVNAQLSSNTVTRGDAVTISAVVKDDAENPIEEATVTATIGDDIIDLSDRGNGKYQGSIDTSDVVEGTYEIVVTAQKAGYESAQTSEILTIEAAVPWMLYGAIAAVTMIVIAAVMLYLARSRPRKA